MVGKKNVMMMQLGSMVTKKMTWNDDRDCAMKKYEYDFEKVDKKGDTCAEQDCIISNSCGLLLRKLQ